MQDYLSYDESMLASLLGTSGPTFFINAGERDNCARKDAAGTFEDRGIIVGLVGPRFQRKGQIDAAYIQPPISPPGDIPMNYEHQRQQDPRVTKLFLDFFGGGPLPTYGGVEFNIKAYQARVRLTIETLFLESDDRAAQMGKTAYIHLVGLGLGVWAVNPMEQGCLYVQMVIQILKEMHLKYVSTVEVAWVSATPDLRNACVKAGKDAGIRVLFNKRPPCQELDTDELLVRCWAWDGNSLPGNEYWSGLLDDSDDPAAMCNSTAAELHNPYVNLFSHRIKVLQDRTRI